MFIHKLIIAESSICLWQLIGKFYIGDSVAPIIEHVQMKKWQFYLGLGNIAIFSHDTIFL